MKQSKFLEFIGALTEKGELDGWLECNDESEVREAIIELIKQSGEVMRERCALDCIESCTSDLTDSEVVASIRAMPGVNIGDLK